MNKGQETLCEAEITRISRIQEIIHGITSKGKNIQETEIDNTDNVTGIKLYKYNKDGYSILLSYCFNETSKAHLKKEYHIFVENKDGKQIIRIDFTSENKPYVSEPDGVSSDGEPRYILPPQKIIHTDEDYDIVGGGGEFKNGKEILDFLEKLINDNFTAGDLAEALKKPNK